MKKWILAAIFCLFAPVCLAQTAVPILQPQQHFVDGSGNACAGCKLYSYAAGTNTPQATYTDSTEGTVNTNPIVLNASGAAAIWMGSSAYKFVLTDTFGTVLWTVDNVLAPSTGETSLGTNSAPGIVQCDGTTINCASGIISVIQGSIPPNADVLGSNSDGAAIVATSPQIAAGLSATPSPVTVSTLTANTSVTTPLFDGVVIPSAGETILHAVGRLPSTGGTVFVPAGSWTVGGSITTPNVAIIGAKMPQVNSGGTAFIAGSGTILEGELDFYGVSNDTAANLGVDVGDTFNDCSADGLVVEPVGDAIASPMLYNVTFENIVTLACDHTFSPSTTQHSVRVEHVTNLFESNIHTDYGFYGVVTKAQNVTQVGITDSNAFSNGWDCKSDDTQGVCANVNVSGLILINSGCAVLDTYGGTVANVTITGLQIYSPSGTCNFGIESHIVTDPTTSVPGYVNGVKISNFIIDSAGSDSMEFENGTTDVSVANGTIRNGGANGVVFQTTGTSGNSAANLNLVTLAGYGVYGFGASDSAANINCNAVATGCVVESGSGGVMTFSSIKSTTTKLTSLTGGAFSGKFAAQGSFTCAATTYCSVGVNWPVPLPSGTYIPVCMVQPNTAGPNYEVSTWIQNQSASSLNVGVYVAGSTALPAGTTMNCTVDTNN